MYMKRVTGLLLGMLLCLNTAGMTVLHAEGTEEVPEPTSTERTEEAPAPEEAEDTPEMAPEEETDVPENNDMPPAEETISMTEEEPAPEGTDETPEVPEITAEEEPEAPENADALNPEETVPEAEAEPEPEQTQESSEEEAPGEADTAVTEEETEVLQDVTAANETEEGYTFLEEEEHPEWLLAADEPMVTINFNRSIIVNDIGKQGPSMCTSYSAAYMRSIQNDAYADPYEGWGSGGFDWHGINDFYFSDLQSALRFCYDKIAAGWPVMAKVGFDYRTNYYLNDPSGYAHYTDRTHYIVLYGFKQSADPNNLKETDFYGIDPVSCTTGPFGVLRPEAFMKSESSGHYDRDYLVSTCDGGSARPVVLAYPDTAKFGDQCGFANKIGEWAYLEGDVNDANLTDSGDIHIRGWAIDNNRKDWELQVIVDLDNGTSHEQKTFWTNKYREDISTWKQTNANHGFEETFSTNLTGTIRMTFTAKVTGGVNVTKEIETVTVQRDRIPVKSVSLNKTKVTLQKGKSTTLKASLNPSTASDKKVTWTSSNTKVATVDKNGKVTAKGAGTAAITVKTNDGKKTGKCTVTVPVTSVKLSKTSLTLNKGKTSALTAAVSPSNASNKKVTWSSSNTKVAAVDKNGKVTAKGLGTATITAKTADGGKTATCKVTVKDSKDPAACTTFGFCRYNGKDYWYENGVRQAVPGDPNNLIDEKYHTERGREIYDPKTKAWYWLDSVFDGAKAVGKEVWMPYIYQEEANWSAADKQKIAYESDPGMGEFVFEAMQKKDGKWVRYDQNGKMMKGWVTITGDLARLYPGQNGNTYYYDTRTGLMAKGWLTIEGKRHHFDEISGKLLK